MTKKELKQMEAEQAKKVQLRRDFLDALKSHLDDIDAIKRVNAINGVKTPDDFEEENLKRYPVLIENGYLPKAEKDEYSLNYHLHDVFHAIRISEYSRYSRSYSFDSLERGLKENELWVTEIIWSDSELYNYIRYMRRFGFDTMVYTSTAGNGLEIITELIEMGGKVIGTNRSERANAGLVIDITGIDLKAWATCKNFVVSRTTDMSSSRKEKLMEMYKAIFQNEE